MTEKKKKKVPIEWELGELWEFSHSKKMPVGTNGNFSKIIIKFY